MAADRDQKDNTKALLSLSRDIQSLTRVCAELNKNLEILAGTRKSDQKVLGGYLESDVRLLEGYYRNFPKEESSDTSEG
jgi:hypothetical protein